MSKREATPPRKPNPIFFPTPEKVRAWLQAHHDSATELWVGYHRKATGRKSITWPESVDEALCFGWIDGIRKTVDEHSYTVRFTPRKSKSIWSAVNIARVRTLKRQGRMHAAGLTAFARRQDDKSAVYSYENRKSAALAAEEEEDFQRRPAAWDFFKAQPAGYRRVACWWVISARKPETRKNRLERLIRVSQAKTRLHES